MTSNRLDISVVILVVSKSDFWLLPVSREGQGKKILHQNFQRQKLGGFDQKNIYEDRYCILTAP